MPTRIRGDDAAKEMEETKLASPDQVEMMNQSTHNVLSILAGDAIPPVQPDIAWFFAHPLCNEVLLRGLSLYLVVVDARSGSYVYASDNLSEYLDRNHWEEQMKLGYRWISTRVHPDDAAAVAKASSITHEYIANQPVSEWLNIKSVISFRLLNLAGEWRKLLQQVIPLHISDAGKLEYFASVCYDITAAKQDNQVAAYCLHRDKHGKDRIIELSTAVNELPDDTAQKPNSILTLREREIARLLAQGLSAKMIADRLKISPQTVAVHRRNLLRKTGSPNQAALAAFVVRTGL